MDPAPSPVEWLPEHHLVFFLLDITAELDLSAIYAVYQARDPRGVKAYEPRMMVALLLYADCVGIPSSRRIERACREDAAFSACSPAISSPTTAGSVISVACTSMRW
jgi:transposase